MSAVVDANITTIIAAIVLLFFGTGSVQGFATTLLLSVIASMFTAIIVTRFLMVNMIRIVKNPRLYTTLQEAQRPSRSIRKGGEVRCSSKTV